MKKMLIVGITMSAAGTENSFLNFVNHIDYSEWSVDLLLAKREGEWLDRIPENINVYDMGEDGDLFTLSKDNSNKIINEFYQKRPFNIFKLFPTLFSIAVSKGNKKTYAKNKLWIKMMREMPRFENEYDLAIGYWGDRTLFYVVDKVNAKHKMAWMHFMFPSPPRSPKTYKKYIDKLDKFVAVSQECSDSIIRAIPAVKDKVVVFENYIDENRVKDLAKGDCPFEKSGFDIVTVGRINYDKGYDVALPAVADFLKEHKEAKWHIVGSGKGSYFNDFISAVNQSGVKDRIVVHGVQSNPYIYIMNADLYFQPSRNESQCMVVDEAKVLCKPILVTDYPTAKRQLENGNLGRICNFNTKEIYNTLNELYINKSLREQYSKRLSDLEKTSENKKSTKELLSFSSI